MALAVWLVGPERLAAQWAKADPSWFFAAVASAGLAQGVSVMRWARIARIFGLQVRLGALALAYAQGMTLNVLLPGATLGGDTLRSIRLQALGNPLGVSALTVLLDRLSGLWVLCVLSLCTGLALTAVLGVHALGSVMRLGGAAGGLPLLQPEQWVWVYLGGLGLLCALPWLPVRKASAAATEPARGWWGRAARRLAGLHDRVLSRRWPLARSLWSSFVVQILCAMTLWLCVRAAGGQAGYWQVQAVAAPVFIAGALPLSYGGFGARELAALAAFPLVGVPGDLGLAASVLYGVVAVVLGLVAAPAFAAVRLPARQTPGG